jgi:tRNA(Ile)-lysidine synthase
MLTTIGIPTQVLTIDWPSSVKPAELPNFESFARKHRYQILGKACRDLEIGSLLLAHHEDDQAETVIMRLMAGHRGAGLMGIKTSSEIPECYGIHGAHQSGLVDNHTKQWHKYQYSHERNILPPEPKTAYPAMISLDNSVHEMSTIPIEEGGIRIYRPMLGFSKSRLIATCQAERMSWFEDVTNKDPTVTTRNAIRHMYDLHSMPVGLAKPSLLALSEKARLRSSILSGKANSWFNRSSLSRFEPGTGILNVRFIDRAQELRDMSLKMRVSSQKEDRQVAALLLRRIITLVTPEEHVHLSALHSAVERIFPELFSLEDPSSPTAFTVAGVKFQISATSKLPEQKPNPATHERLHPQKHEWLVSRQPHTANVDKQPLITVPPSRDLPSKRVWSPWTLYDGRYWIRIQNRTAFPICIRPFRKEDLLDFKKSLADQKTLRNRLKTMAPSDVRWTLPAIVIREINKESVLSLLTLDISVLDVETLVAWEVRYKKVDIEGVIRPR